jgi:hypothetical protein
MYWDVTHRLLCQSLWDSGGRAGADLDHYIVWSLNMREPGESPAGPVAPSKTLQCMSSLDSVTCYIIAYLPACARYPRLVRRILQRCDDRPSLVSSTNTVESEATR